MQIGQLKRREFITLLGGAAAAWPFAARAQQGERTRRIGVLMNFAADDPEARALIATFVQGLSELGWQESRTLQIDIRWGTDDAETSRTQVKELLALAPDVILATTTSKVQVLRQASRTLPIVFGLRPGWWWVGREPSPSWRQRYGLCPPGIRYQRQMAGTAQRDSAPGRARRGSFRFGEHSRSWATRGDSSCRTVDAG